MQYHIPILISRALAHTNVANFESQLGKTKKNVAYFGHLNNTLQAAVVNGLNKDMMWHTVG